MSKVLLFAEKTARQLRRDAAGTAITVLTTPVCTALYGLLSRGGDGPGGRPFEASVPGLLVLSVIMIVFSSAMLVAREIESGATTRMATWPVSALDVLGGSSLVQLGLAAASSAATLAAARALGYAPRASLIAVLVLAVVAAQSSIGLGLLVASLTRTQHRAFLVASVLMFVLLLFSGVVFPRPRVELVQLAGEKLGPFDVLPTTQLHEALSGVLAGKSLLEVKGRLLALFGLSAVAFGAGVLVFSRRHTLGGR